MSTAAQTATVGGVVFTSMHIVFTITFLARQLKMVESQKLSYLLFTNHFTLGRIVPCELDACQIKKQTPPPPPPQKLAAVVQIYVCMLVGRAHTVCVMPHIFFAPFQIVLEAPGGLVGARSRPLAVATSEPSITQTPSCPAFVPTRSRTRTKCSCSGAITSCGT